MQSSESKHHEEKNEIHKHEVEVVVEYVGKQDFSDGFPGTATFQDVKVKAMKFFGLEHSAQDNYVLKYKGVDLPKDGKLESLHEKKVVLRLELVKEPVKG